MERDTSIESMAIQEIEDAMKAAGGTTPFGRWIDNTWKNPETDEMKTIVKDTATLAKCYSHVSTLFGFPPIYNTVNVPNNPSK